MSKKIKVGKNSYLDMLKFKNLGKTRDKVIDEYCGDKVFYSDPISDKN